MADSLQIKDSHQINKLELSSEGADSVLSDIKKKQLQAALHKANGNEAFKLGDLQKAIMEYHLAILNLQGLDRSIMGMQTSEGQSKAELSGVESELSLIYSNMSAVQLKRGNWARAISCADDALKKNPKNIKAAYRKATALHSNGEPFKAKRVLKDLGDLTDPSVKALLSQIEKDEKARSAKADNKLRGFLNK